jgi:hypothetical protein
MTEDIALPCDLPAVACKKVSAACDGGRITSDGGVMLLAYRRRIQRGETDSLEEEDWLVPAHHKRGLRIEFGSSCI